MPDKERCSPPRGSMIRSTTIGQGCGGAARSSGPPAPAGGLGGAGTVSRDLSEKAPVPCLPLRLIDVPVLAVEDAAYHGKNQAYSDLFLVGFQQNNGLREGVQFDGGNLRFQFRLVVDGLIDFFLALAVGDGLGDRQVALGQLLVDRCGLLRSEEHTSELQSPMYLV